MSELSASERYAHALSATITLQAVEHSLHAARNAVANAGAPDLRDDLQKAQDQLLRLTLRAFKLRDRINSELDVAQVKAGQTLTPEFCEAFARDHNGVEFICRWRKGHTGGHSP